MQRKQIAIACNDGIGPAIEGNLQEFVVLGIAAGLHPMGYIDHNGKARQQSKELIPVRRFQIAIEFRAAQHLAQFRQR